MCCLFDPCMGIFSILGIVQVNFRYELIQNVRSTYSTCINHHLWEAVKGSQYTEKTLKKPSFTCHSFLTVKGFPSKCTPNLYELCSSMYFTQALKSCQKEENLKSLSRMFACWHGRHSDLPNNAWIGLATMLWKKRKKHMFPNGGNDEMVIYHGTPLKTNMEHHHEGLFQIIFLSKWKICRYRPFIFQGVTSKKSP